MHRETEPQRATALPDNQAERGARAPRRHWPDIARQWEQVGPPLRPSAQDIAFYTEAINGWAAERKPPRALILGVTPELYNLPWPAGTDVLAVDRTQGMIDMVWPGPRDAVICADWTQMPLDDASRHIVLCDGGIHLMTYPRQQLQFVRGLQRIVAPGGICVFRLYVPPHERESPQAVLEDLLAGNIASLNILKLRLGMSLHEDAACGVELRRVWDALHDAAPDFGQLVAKIGWSIEHLSAINTYRDCESRYHFVSIDELSELSCRERGGFELESVHVPTYELGDRCPTIVLRRIGD